jgi:hypothetical protein
MIGLRARTVNHQGLSAAIDSVVEAHGDHQGAAESSFRCSPWRIDRINVLRQAFDRTMTDPAFLAEAAKLNMDVKPLGGAELQRIAVEVVQAPSADLARAKELIGAAR